MDIENHNCNIMRSDSSEHVMLNIGERAYCSSVNKQESSSHLIFHKNQGECIASDKIESNILRQCLQRSVRDRHSKPKEETDFKNCISKNMMYSLSILKDETILEFCDRIRRNLTKNKEWLNKFHYEENCFNAFMIGCSTQTRQIVHELEIRSFKQIINNFDELEKLSKTKKLKQKGRRKKTKCFCCNFAGHVFRNCRK